MTRPLRRPQSSRRRELLECETKAAQRLFGSGLDQRDAQGRTALHFAASEGLATLANALMEAGADVATRDATGATPLHLAAAVNARMIVELLIAAGAPATLCDHRGDTPLHRATAANAEATARVLLVANVDLDAVNDDGATPLHLAAMRAPTRAAVSRPGGAADTDPVPRRALQGDETVIASWLITNGAALDPVDAAGFTPLDHALRRDRTRLIHLLESSGARTSCKLWLERHGLLAVPRR